MRRYGGASQGGGTYSAMSAPLSGVYYAGGSATAALYGGRRSSGGVVRGDGRSAAVVGSASAAAGSSSGGAAGAAGRALRRSAHNRGDSAHGACGPAASPIDVRRIASQHAVRCTPGREFANHLLSGAFHEGHTCDLHVRLWCWLVTSSADSLDMHGLQMQGGRFGSQPHALQRQPFLGDSASPHPLATGGPMPLTHFAHPRDAHCSASLGCDVRVLSSHHCFTNALWVQAPPLRQEVQPKWSHEARLPADCPEAKGSRNCRLHIEGL